MIVIDHVVQCKYVVTTKTADVDRAGTDDNIYITIGKHGSRTLLDNGKKDDFERGQ